MVGAAAAAVIWRTRRGLRSFATLLAGGWGLVGSMELFIERGPRGGLQADDVSGILSLVAGVVLVGTFVYFASVSASRGRRRATRVLRRGATAVGLFVAAYVVVLPSGCRLHGDPLRADAGITSAPDIGVAASAWSSRPPTACELTGWYAPTQNGAVVLILPGRSGVDHARMLARHGYGVLLLNRRGEADSEGETNLFGWADPHDIAGAAEYLPQRDGASLPAPSAGSACRWAARSCSSTPPDQTTCPASSWRAWGLARSRRAWSCPVASGSPSSSRRLSSPAAWSCSPTRLRRRTSSTWPRTSAPARALIVWGEDGQPAEKVLGPTYAEAAGDAASSWEVPGATHTGGIDAAPDEYERRVIAFFDSTLLSHP